MLAGKSHRNLPTGRALVAQIGHVRLRQEGTSHVSPGRRGRGRDDLQVFKPGPGFFITLDPTAAKCASADPAIRPPY